MSRQQPLFETEPAPWEFDQASEQLVATVVFPGGPQTVFHYRVPDGLRDQMEPGRRVRAPFGRSDRMQIGYCVQLETRSDVPRRLKSVAEVVDSRALLSPTMLRLTQWMADHYLVQLGRRLGSGAAGRRAIAGGNSPRDAAFAGRRRQRKNGRTASYRKSNSKSSGFWPRIRNRSNPANWPVPPTAHRRRSRRCGTKEF